MDSLDPKEFERWARIGVDQDGIKYMPIAGICLMAYLISKRDDEILVAKISGDKYSEVWRNEWGMYTHRRFIWENKWFVPSGFLKFGETPQSCADRLLHRLLLAEGSFKLSTVVSFTTDSRYYPNYHHWHVCFVYDVKDLKLDENRPPWFETLEYVPIPNLDLNDIAVEGSEVMKQILL